MCRTVHSLLQTAICTIQMVVRTLMTTMLMIENIIRMVMQTLYNFISFMLQMLSLIPICVVFLLTAKLKCFMCGGGGPCPVNRGGACDCLMSLVAIVALFFIFRATGVLDKLFYSIGYAKAYTPDMEYVPTTGTITECSRNDTIIFADYSTMLMDGEILHKRRNKTEQERFIARQKHRMQMQQKEIFANIFQKNQSLWLRTGPDLDDGTEEANSTSTDSYLTTIVYYLA